MSVHNINAAVNFPLPYNIGQSTAEEVLDVFRAIPDYHRRGFTHFEEIQFFVDHISKDRNSGYAAAVYRFRLDNTAEDDDRNHCWLLADGLSDIPAGAPKISNITQNSRSKSASISCHPERCGNFTK